MTTATAQVKAICGNCHSALLITLGIDANVACQVCGSVNLVFENQVSMKCSRCSTVRSGGKYIPCGCFGSAAYNAVFGLVAQPTAKAAAAPSLPIDVAEKTHVEDSAKGRKEDTTAAASKKKRKRISV